MKTTTIKSGNTPWATAGNSGPSLENFEPMTKSQAAAFIVDQLEISPRERRNVSNNVMHRLGYALQEGHLQLDRQKKIPFEDLIVWCNSKTCWGTKFVRFAGVNRATSNNAMGSFQSSGVLHALPTNHDAALAALAACHRELHQLKTERGAMAEELSRLRPFLEAKEVRSQQSSVDGKKGRGIPKR